eukprot:65923_1
MLTFMTLNTSKTILKRNKSVSYFSNSFQVGKNIANICSTEKYEQKMSLNEFVIKAHEYIKNRQLELRQYKRCIISILWKLATIIYLLEYINKSFMVKLCPKSITLYGVHFANNVVTINQNVFVSVKMERIVPGLESQVSDLAILIYYCFIGEYPYKVTDITENNQEFEFGSCLWAIKQNKLKQYLAMNNKLKFVNSKILSLLNGLITLLNINPTERLNAADILNHRLFARFNGWIRG